MFIPCIQQGIKRAWLFRDLGAVRGEREYYTAVCCLYTHAKKWHMEFSTIARIFTRAKSPPRAYNRTCARAGRLVTYTLLARIIENVSI